MSKHEPNGKHLCIHSVVINEKYRRNGYGLLMVKKYVESIENDKNSYDGNVNDGNGLESIRLVSKEHLIPFYSSNGFKLIGESDLDHGKDKWFEMVIDY